MSLISDWQKYSSKSLMLKGRKAEKLFNVLFNLSSSGIYIVRDGKIQFFNPQFEKLSGYSKDELFKLTNPIKLVYPKDRNLVKESTAKMLKGDQTSPFEYRFVKKNGEIRWAMETVTSIRNDHQHITLGNVIDVTALKQAGNELRESEERYRRIVETANEGIWIINEENLIVFINNKMAAMLNFTQKEMIGKPLFDFMDKNSRVIAQTYVDRRSQGICETHDFRFHRADGSDLWAVISTTPILDQNQQYSGTLGMVTDITSRKRTEKKLITALMDSRRREEEIKALLDSTKAVLKYEGFIDRAQVIYSCCKDLIGASCGYIMLFNQDDSYYLPFIDLGDSKCNANIPDSFPPIRGIRNEAYRSGKVTFQNDFTNTDYQKLIPGGHIKIENVLYAPLFIDGKVVGLLGLANKQGGFNQNDIRMLLPFSELAAISLYNSRTLELLKKSEDRFSKAFNASPNIMSISTYKEERYFNVNESFSRVLGFLPEEVLDRTSSELNIWANPEEHSRIIQTLNEHSSLRNLETEMRTKSGELRTGLYSAEIIELNGQKCILSSVNDITDYKRLEQEMDRLERFSLIGEMAASIGHEVRNPMTTVRGFLQMLSRNDECARYRNYFNIMIEELDRANSIITEYLSLAKNKTVDLKNQNLNSILNTLYPLITADVMNANKYFVLETGEIPNLQLNEKEIRQLILNLVRNGLEAMESDGTISIRTYIDGKEVVLAVQDEGPGIDAKKLEKIWTPFYTTKETGTGMGLPVCYGIANRHNASINVSTSTSGTIFLVRFKVQE